MRFIYDEYGLTEKFWTNTYWNNERLKKYYDDPVFLSSDMFKSSINMYTKGMAIIDTEEHNITVDVSNNLQSCHASDKNFSMKDISSGAIRMR